MSEKLKRVKKTAKIANGFASIQIYMPEGCILEKYPWKKFPSPFSYKQTDD